MIKGVMEKAKIAGQLIPDRYDITVGQIREIQGACEGDIYDLIRQALIFLVCKSFSVRKFLFMTEYGKIIYRIRLN